MENSLHNETTGNTTILLKLNELFPVDKEIWDHAGITCFTAKNPFNGLNGYVILPEEHNLYTVDQNDLYKLNVHGGITFDYTLDGIGRVIGWDTCHYGDRMDPEFIPTEFRSTFGLDHLFAGRIWTREDVIEETNSLAHQVANW